MVLLGGALLPVGMWLGYRWVGPAAIAPLILIFQVGLNLPHYFQTYTLTYLDPAMRKREAARLWAAAAVAVTLPVAAILLGPLALKTTLTLLTFWGFYHITQQTRGLVGLYLRRGRPRAGSNDPRLRGRLLIGLFTGTGASLAMRAVTFGPALNGQPFDPALPVAAVLAALSVGAFVSALPHVRWPTLPALLLAILNVGVFALAVTVPDLNLVLVIATSWHAAQYLGLVHQAQRNREGNDWFASLARRELVGFFAIAIGFAAVMAGLGGALPKPWGQAVYLPLLLLHYLNDAWLWSPLRNPEAKAWLAPLQA